MKLFSLTKTMITDNFRQFEIVFWSIVFPAVFFLFFNALFSGVQNGDMNTNLKIGVYYEENLTGMAEQIFEGTFKEISKSNMIKFSTLKSKNEGINLIKEKKIDSFIVFPKNFNSLNLNMVFNLVKVPSIEFYYYPGNDSIFSKNIFKSIVDEMNVRIANKGKEFKVNSSEEAINLKKSLKYKDFLFPGILMMSILTISIFNMPIGIITDVESGIIKKLNTSPIKSYHYFFAFGLSNFLVLILSISLFYFEAYLLKVTNVIYSIQFIIFLIYSAITALSFGLLFASFFKKISTISVVSNVAYQMTIFLSGLYFSVKTTPWFIRWYVYFNPATYLVDGMRNLLEGKSVGGINYLIPAIWFVIGIVTFSINYKRVMKYE
ncbi:ABC transporter [Tepiditoga spiralis]|uniref:ABC transporter n=1 Tax=Tepiditoga spiralis TaxID=2108365 RepID=A0A7G1G112_9BACT|nr:ABC transporter permease [Tepiditoga spiralis]BBE29921.1 ABC transporter [Tepiditoga spiralis]